MHEFSLVQALLNRVEVEAQAANATSVHRLSVRIGVMAGVERELFNSAYELCREGTICERAELFIEPVEARWVCRGCGQEIISGQTLLCPACGSPPRLEAGDEIVLDQIEMEVA
jgi:hydrogenase nickel incorporation protein HypA/HybF